jgi:hypothetical protein
MLKLTTSGIGLLREDIIAEDGPCCGCGNNSCKGKEEVLFGWVVCQRYDGLFGMMQCKPSS